LKKIVCLLVVFLAAQLAGAQNLHLKIYGKSDLETKTIDSIGYASKHPNAKEVVQETNLFSKKMAKLGYLEYQIESNQKTNDSTFVFYCSLGRKTERADLYISKESPLKTLGILRKARHASNPLHRNRIVVESNISKTREKRVSRSPNCNSSTWKKRKKIRAEMLLIQEKQRSVNDIVVNGYKIPRRTQTQHQTHVPQQDFQPGKLKEIACRF
jgi:hypothetical protein